MSEVSPGPDGEPVATPAATVVPLRTGTAGMEVLLVRRRQGGAFGGLWVFPGGRVEPADAASAVALASDRVGERGTEVAVARRAALREAAEEAGLELDGQSIVVHSWWLPPKEAPKRYSTGFFLAEAGEAQVTLDREEVREHRWSTPRAALAARDAGEIGLAPPTWITLWQLRRFPEPAAALAEAAARPPREFVTHLAREPGGCEVVLWEGDAGYLDGDLIRPGPRRRLRVPPGAPWEAELSSEGGARW